MARPLATQPKTYDESKLLAMTAPFNVRVEKIRGSTRSPIPLPESEDGSPGGTNWGPEDIRGVEQWLVTEWSGGGLYEITVTDSSPTPQKLTWQPFYDPKQYPERTPPPLLEAASAAAPPPPSNVTPLHPHQPQGAPYMTAFPRGLPQYPYQQYVGQPVQPQYGFQAPMPNPPMPGSLGWAPWQAEVERRERDAKDRERDQELQRERERREKLERDTLDARHKAELERERLANAAQTQALQTQLNEMRAMITQLASSLKEGHAAARVSPEIEQMREANRQTEARLERERLEREAERREMALREMIKSMQDSVRQQVDMLQRQFDDRTRALEAAAKDGKPDQFLMVWQQSQREMMELSKELSRNQASQMQAMQAFMMNPRDMLALAKESTSTVEQAIDRSNNFYGRMIETQQKMTENLLAMTPQSNGVVEIVGSGVEKLGSLAERYLGGKQMEQQLNAQVQVTVAEAQARAYAETVKAQQAAAQPQAPPPQTQAAGFGTPPPAVQSTETKRPKKAKVEAANDQAPQPIADPNKKRFGKTDEQWFGMLMPQVEELRSNAHAFIKSIAENDLDKKGNPKGLDPEHTAMVLTQAIGLVQQRQLPIPVMMELLFQNRFADFIEVVLPDPVVTEQYRIEVTQHLLGIARKAQGLDPTPEPDDDKSTGDADDADDDDDRDEDQEIEASADDDADDAADDDGDAEPNTDKAQDGKVSVQPPKTNGKAPVVPLRRA